MSLAPFYEATPVYNRAKANNFGPVPWNTDGRHLDGSDSDVALSVG